MELSLTFLVLLIFQFSSFNSLRYKRDIKDGFESCNSDPFFDDFIDEFLPSDDNAFLNDDRAWKRTAGPSTEAPTRIKDKAVIIAESAADAAQAANEALDGAALAASRQVKMQLANRAADAARTAQTAFEASQMAYDNLERQLCDEGALLERLTVSKAVSEANVNTAKTLYTRAEHLSNAMQTQMEETKIAVVKLDDLIEQGTDELAQKNRSLDMLKECVDRLKKKLEEANKDYQQAQAEVKKINSKKCRKVSKYQKAIPRSNTVW